jgi:hypothetical protein
VIALAAQLAQEGSFQQLDIQPVGFGPPVLARDRHARRMDDMGLDAVRPQPTRQPEAVPPGLEGNRNTRDTAPRSGRLVAPAQQFSLIRRELLQRMPFDPRDNRADQLAWLISITAINVLSWSRATRDLLRSFGCGIGVLHRLFATTMVPSLAARPIPS